MKEVAQMRAELQIQNLIDREIEAGRLNGANLLVLRHGHVVYDVARGQRDAQRTKPFTRSTILRLFSQSKPITAAAAMILVERGLLDLEEPVSDILPSFKGQRVCKTMDSKPMTDFFTDGAKGGALSGNVSDVKRSQEEKAEEKITEPLSRPLIVRNLLTMTSGLPYPTLAHLAGQQVNVIFNDLIHRLRTDHEMTTAEFADRMGRTVLHFQPGSHWEYGTSADIIGAIIEKVSGQKFGDFLKENIFDPLGMHETAFWVPEQRRDRLADIFENPDNPMDPAHRGKLIPLHPDNLGIDYTASHEPAFQSGGAGLLSTLDDYARFATMLLNNGTLDGERILSPSAVTYMRTDGLTNAQEHEDFENGWSGTGYNCFMRTITNPGSTGFVSTPGEYGWDGWLGTYFRNIPAWDATILLGIQKANTGTDGFTRRLRNLIGSLLQEED
jgi:CubicO group peptidase (beta-lactamase class C family)